VFTPGRGLGEESSLGFWVTAFRRSTANSDVFIHVEQVDCLRWIRHNMLGRGAALVGWKKTCSGSAVVKAATVTKPPTTPASSLLGRLAASSSFSLSSRRWCRVVSPWIHSRRNYATEGHESKASEGADENPEDPEQVDGEKLMRREMINQARPRMEDHLMHKRDDDFYAARAQEYYEEKAKRSAEHLNDVLSRKFLAWNIVGLGNTLGLFLLFVLILRLLHFLYQTRVHLKFQQYALDYDEMAEEDAMKDIKRPEENTVPPPTSQVIPSSFAVSASDSSQARQEVSDLEKQRDALDAALKQKTEALQPRWTILGPVEKAAYSFSSFLAVMKTLMSWPSYVDDARALLEDTEPHIGETLEGLTRSRRVEDNFDPETESSILGHLPGPEDNVYGRPITLLLDTDLLLTPGIDKEAGIVTMRRPGIENFMSRVAPYAEIVLISTNHDEDEGTGICEKLDPYNFRTACLNKSDTWRYKYRSAKPLSSQRLGRPQSRIVAFDKDYELCGAHCDNVLLLSNFNGTRGDSAMVDMIPFVQFLAVAAQQGRDVREVIAHYRGIPIDKAVKYVKDIAEEERSQKVVAATQYKRKA
jgi:hypothetical protein